MTKATLTIYMLDGGHWALTGESATLHPYFEGLRKAWSNPKILSFSMGDGDREVFVPRTNVACFTYALLPPKRRWFA